ncbi:MAG: type II toxin-antitoxin system Phd/YefM family antitoxin [Acidobacteria bacterium]|nr:type II toxin-antitoxin system Phd/YefM family antitoxin [Acidobacteriota bacterium]
MRRRWYLRRGFIIDDVPAVSIEVRYRLPAHALRLEELREQLGAQCPALPGQIVRECNQVVRETYANLHTRDHAFRNTLHLDDARHLHDTCDMPIFVSSRELSARPGKVLRNLRKAGPIVVTRDGEPAAILLPASARTIETDLDLARRIELSRAIDDIRQEAREKGLDKLRSRQVNAIIREVRQRRRRRGTR